MAGGRLLALGLGEELGRDERLVRLLGGPYPGVSVGPSELRGVAEGDVLDVDEDLVPALAAPHLATGVAGVRQDGPHGALPPGAAARAG